MCKSEVVHVFTSKATGGRFSVNPEDLEKLVSAPKGLDWGMALGNEGWFEPNYGEARLKIETCKKNKTGFDVSGTITLIGNKVERFSGKIETAGDHCRKKLECRFTLM